MNAPEQDNEQDNAQDNERDDALVRATFQELRREDEQAQPAFRTVISRVAEPRSRPWFPQSLAWRMAATGVVIVSASFAYRSTAMHRQTFTVPRDISALATWQPATNVFMPSPDTLAGAASSISSSMIDFTPYMTRPRL